MKNFINNILGYTISAVVLVVVFAIGVIVGATVMNHSGDIFTSLAAAIVTPIGIMDGLFRL